MLRTEISSPATTPAPAVDISIPWRSRGFTLVELLVVVSIMALLMSILLPSLRSAKGTARNAVCQTNLRSIYLAQTLLLETRQRFQPLNNEEDDGNWQYNYLINDGNDWKSNFGPLVTDKRLLHEIKLLYCPFQKDPFHSLDTSDNPWPPNDGFDTRAAYARRHLLTDLPLSHFKKTTAFFSDVMHLPKVIKSGHERGLNAVYSDGHVSWVSDPGIFANNELGIPFDQFDNPIVDAIWKAMDKNQ